MITPILFKFDTVVQTAQPETPFLKFGLESVLSDCLGIETALRTLYEDFEGTMSGPLYWPELSTLETSHTDKKGKPFPVSFHFSTFIIAQFVITYWAGLMVLHRQIASTYQALMAFDPAYQSQCRDSADTIFAMVANICQSVEYLTSRRMGGMGLLAVIIPLHGCKPALHDVAVLKGVDLHREITCVLEMIDLVQRRFSFDINLSMNRSYGATTGYSSIRYPSEDTQS